MKTRVYVGLVCVLLSASAAADEPDRVGLARRAREILRANCYRCHGVDAFGGQLAPDLRKSVSSQGSVTHDVFLTTVKEGRIPKGMPDPEETDLEATARRETLEETGVCAGVLTALGSIRYSKSGKEILSAYKAQFPDA